MNTSSGSNFCRHPWQGLDISPQGEYKPCCKYSSTIATSLDDYLKSDELRDLKQAFLSGEKPEKCKRCWSDEAAGVASKRQIDFRSYYATTEINDSIKVLSAAFGNTCNLACRHCSSYVSSHWRKDALKLGQDKVFQHVRFYKDPKWIEQLKELGQSAVLIEFPGGEPFLTGVEQHKDFLRFLIDNNPGQKVLHYMTNGTVMPDEEFLHLWKDFKSVEIQLSVDGIGKRFEYMRNPGNWSVFEDGVQVYKTYQKQISNLKIGFSHTVSILNVYYLQEFLDWSKVQGIEHPYCGLVVRPNYYDIRNLPTAVKEQVIEHVQDSKIRNYISQPAALSNMDLFWSVTDKLDELRKESYAKCFPEFAEILKAKY